MPTPIAGTLSRREREIVNVLFCWETVRPREIRGWATAQVTGSAPCSPGSKEATSVTEENLPHLS